MNRSNAALSTTKRLLRAKSTMARIIATPPNSGIPTRWLRAVGRALFLTQLLACCWATCRPPQLRSVETDLFVAARRPNLDHANAKLLWPARRLAFVSFDCEK